MSKFSWLWHNRSRKSWNSISYISTNISINKKRKKNYLNLQKIYFEFKTNLNPWLTSLRTSLGCRWLWFWSFWFWWICRSLTLLLYCSNFFCNCEIECALFWFFFSKTAFILWSCCLSALAANFRYSFTLSKRDLEKNMD